MIDISAGRKIHNTLIEKRVSSGLVLAKNRLFPFFGTLSLGGEI